MLKVLVSELWVVVEIVMGLFNINTITLFYYKKVIILTYGEWHIKTLF